MASEDFDYGYIRPDKTFEYNVNYGIRIYRITYTNVDGEVHEFSAKEVQQWSIANNLIPVYECYYGYAKDLYNIPEDENWSINFLEKLSRDKNFFMEKNSPDCINKVPHEGLVLKIEDGKSHAWKIKCIKFLEKETINLNNNVGDIEA